MSESIQSKIVEAAGFLLFSRRPTPSFLLMQHATRWDLPKGHVEPGEAILAAALRETQEETGIAATEIEIDAEFRFALEYEVYGKKRGDYRKRTTYFLGFVNQQHTPLLTEHIGFAWFEWPVSVSLQAQTIDPLLAAVEQHWSGLPSRFLGD